MMMGRKRPSDWVPGRCLTASDEWRRATPSLVQGLVLELARFQAPQQAPLRCARPAVRRCEALTEPGTTELPNNDPETAAAPNFHFRPQCCSPPLPAFCLSWLAPRPSALIITCASNPPHFTPKTTTEQPPPHPTLPHSSTTHFLLLNKPRCLSD